MMNQMKKKNQQKYKIDAKPFYEGPFYNIKKICDPKQSQRVLYFQYKYDLNKVNEFGLKKHLKFYNEVFLKKGTEIMVGKNLHFVTKQQLVDQTNSLYVYIRPFKCRLNQYIQHRAVSQQECMEIMKQILQAIYSVYKDQFSCINIRAQNFVLVVSTDANNKPYSRWKLESLPYGYNCQNKLNSQTAFPCLWREQYKPVEAYKQLLSTAQLTESLVWSVGCMFLHILAGKHLLSNLDSINKFYCFCLKQHEIDLSHFGINTKISAKLSSIIKRMLQQQPQNRMKVNELFLLPDFSQNIMQYIKNKQEQKLQAIKEIRKQEQSSLISAQKQQKIELVQASSIFQRQYKLWYKNLDQFIMKIVNIIEQKKLPFEREQKAAIQNALDRQQSKLLSKRDVTMHSHQFIPRLKPSKSLQNIMQQYDEIREITLQQFQRNLKPYKFYLDKTIFLFRFTERFGKKIPYILSKKLKQNKKVGDNQQIDKNIYKEVFIFKYIMIFMRLIYLQTILQNLKLRQNIFNIPKCFNNIDNFSFDNTHHQWLIFSRTSIYEALILYIAQKFNECEKQLSVLIEQGQEQQKKWSQSFIKKIKHIQSLDYRICGLHRFMPVYQTALKNVASIIDTYSVTNAGFKNYQLSLNDIDYIECMKNIGYLINAIFIESQKIYSEENRYKLFQRYMMKPQQESGEKLIFHNRSSLPYQLQLLQVQNNEQKQNAFQLENTKDIFDFTNYEKFLRKGQPQKIVDHVSYLLLKFQI